MRASMIARRGLLAGISAAVLARGQSSDAPHLGTLYQSMQQIMQADAWEWFLKHLAGGAK